MVLNDALELNPGVSDTWLNRGIALVKLNEYEEAMDCFDRALQLNPNNENAKHRRNKCWYKWKLLEKREQKLMGGKRRRAVGVARPMGEYDYQDIPPARDEYAGSSAGGAGVRGASTDYYSEPAYAGASTTDTYADEPPPRCPKCGQPLKFVDEYESWYCDSDDIYPFDD